MRYHSLIRLAETKIDADDTDIRNDQSNSKATPRNEVVCELLVRVPRRTGIRECIQLNTVVIVESLEGMAADFQQIEAVLESIEPLILAVPGVDVPSAKRIGPADMKILVNWNFLAYGSRLKSE